jgi:transposase
VAHVLVSKYADHLPLYRQEPDLRSPRIELDRSTLADWVGRAAAELRPLHERLFEHLKRPPKLFMDETRAPVLDPGRRRTKSSYLWAIARDDRPWIRRRSPISRSRSDDRANHRMPVSVLGHSILGSTLGQP